MKTISFLILQQSLRDSSYEWKLFFSLLDSKIILGLICFMALIFLILLFRNLINESAEKDAIILELQKKGKVILQGTLYFKGTETFWDQEKNYVYGYFYEEQDCFIDIKGKKIYKSALKSTDLEEYLKTA